MTVQAGDSSAPKGVVLFNLRQVENMQDTSETLRRYFAGLTNGRAEYVNGECITPTVEQAIEALHLLQDVLGHPIRTLETKQRSGAELAKEYGDARL